MGEFDKRLLGVLKNNLLDIRIWVIYVWFLEEFW
jgi:hypothetical protein